MPMHAHQVRWQCSGRTLGVAGDDASQTTTRALQKRDTTSHHPTKCVWLFFRGMATTGWAIRRRGSGSGGTAR